MIRPTGVGTAARRSQFTAREIFGTGVDVSELRGFTIDNPLPLEEAVETLKKYDSISRLGKIWIN